MNEDFKIVIASDQAHDRVCAEIYFDDKFVALVSQEAGQVERKSSFPEQGSMRVSF